MITIIMMTMLIAIISDAYSHAMENMEKAKTKSLAELILDTELLMVWNRCRSRKDKHFIVFAEQSD
jgi:hypothetical protein